MPPAQFIRQMLSTHIYLDKFTKLLSQHTSIDDVREFIDFFIYAVVANPTHMAAVHRALAHQIRAKWSTATRS
jgi:hypothetical protein